MTDVLFADGTSNPRQRLLRAARLLPGLGLLWFAGVILPGCQQGAPNEARLSSLSIMAQSYTVEGTRNLSGITWHGERQSLFVISNRPAAMAEVSPQGTLLRVIHLEGFEDTEDLAWLGGERFAILEERRALVHIVDIPAHAQRISREGHEVIALPPFDGDDNKGYEALAYDAGQDVLYTGRETGPVHLYRLADVHADGRSGDWEPIGFLPVEDGDVAGLAMDRESGDLLLLNERARMVTEISPQAQVVARRRIGTLWWGASQPEGLALDDRGNLYIVGEPDQLYVYQARH